MELFSQLFSESSNLHTVQRRGISEKFRVFQLCVMEQLSFKFSFLSAQNLSVESGRLARVLSRHVASERLAMLKDITTFFAYISLIRIFIIFFIRCLYFLFNLLRSSSFLQQLTFLPFLGNFSWHRLIHTFVFW